MTRMSNGKLLAILSLIFLILLWLMARMVWNSGTDAGLGIGILLAPALIVLQIMLMIGLGMRGSKDDSEDRASHNDVDSRGEA